VAKAHIIMARNAGGTIRALAMKSHRTSKSLWGDEEEGWLQEPEEEVAHHSGARNDAF